MAVGLVDRKGDVGLAGADTISLRNQIALADPAGAIVGDGVELGEPRRATVDVDRVAKAQATNKEQYDGEAWQTASTLAFMVLGRRTKWHAASV